MLDLSITYNIGILPILFRLSLLPTQVLFMFFLKYSGYDEETGVSIKI